ncbi:NPCBM/NEW2 domain-containing protein [Streptomyces sp. MN03-5084-2B]|nr:NPCBM/NEW2 domain-containing protein [Streptomyces sp. MN03-5084-2B]
MTPPPSSEHHWTKIGGIAAVIAIPIAVIAIIVAHSDATPAPSASTATTNAPTSSPNLINTPTTDLTTPYPSDTSTSAPTGPGTVTYIADMQPIADNWTNEGKIQATPINGVTYAHGMSTADCFAHDGPFSFEYNLGKRYASFDAVAGVTDFTEDNWKSEIEFSVDGRPAQHVNVQIGHTQKVSFSVAGALRLKIVVSTTGGQGGCGYPDDQPHGPALGDPKLTQ